jgi:hypothetical protein
MKRRLIAPAAAVLLAMALVAVAAYADADPASDVLLGENVFYPYSPPVSGPVQGELNAEVAAAGKAGFPIKVAIIGSPVDLGAVPNLFAKPQDYAKFLDQEISFQATKQPLLVVMPSGFGVGGLSAPATAAAASLPKPAGSQSDDLARAAAGAIPKLAGASGHRVSSVAGASGGGSGSSAVPIVIALAVVAVLAAGGVLAVRRRAARAR